MKQGYRVIIVDKDGVMVCESQLTENDLPTRRRSSRGSSSRSKTSKKKNRDAEEGRCVTRETRDREALTE